MTNNYRASIERHNAPFRGVSSREDAVNFDLAVLHDLFHIEKVSGGNTHYPGHKQHIKDNFSSLLIGEGQATSTIPTAGTLMKVIKPIEDKQDPTQWTKQNGATLTKEQDTYLLNADGKQLEAGLSTIVEVNPGDILSIRLKGTKVKGQGVQIALGAANFDNDGDELKVVDLDTFETSQYIEKRLYCRSRQEVRLVVYVVHQIAYENNVSLQLEDFSLNLLSETPVGLIGTDSQLKRDLKKEEQYIEFLEERITKRDTGRDA